MPVLESALLKRDSGTSVFLVNTDKILRTPICEWLLFYDYMIV